MKEKKRHPKPGGKLGRTPRAGTAATHSIRAPITEAELAYLDAVRGDLTRAEYVRRCVFGVPAG